MRPWGIFKTFTLSVTVNVMLVQFLSVTGYGQKIIEGRISDGLTLRHTHIELYIVGYM